MRICLVGPIATADVSHLLDGGCVGLPEGYPGAPLMAVLAEELLRQGHEVVAVTTDNTLPLARGESLVRSGPGFSLRVCPSRPRAWRPNGWRLGRAFDLFQFERRQLRDAIRQSRADVVHAHWTYEFAWAALDSGLPTLVTCHDSAPMVLRHSRSPYRALRYLMARHVLGRAQHLTAVSDYMAREIGQLVPGAAVQVVPNPVARHVFALGRVRQTGPSPSLAMVCNGWGPLKNPKAALKAFAQFRQAVPEASLHCFGLDFGPGGTAERWASEQGLAVGLRFRGPMAHRALMQSVAELDGLLHPSLEESFGVVIAEAMALGLPVVAGQDSGAVAWVLLAETSGDGRDQPGVLTDVRVPEAITCALHTCFDADYGARSAAGLSAARSRFSVEAVAAAYLRRYQEVCRAGMERTASQALTGLRVP